MTTTSILYFVLEGPTSNKLMLSSQVMSAVSMFYLAHWAAFVTGKMLFGLIDVTEAQMCIIGLFLTHTLLGPTFWEIEVRREECTQYFVSGTA